MDYFQLFDTFGFRKLPNCRENIIHEKYARELMTNEIVAVVFFFGGGGEWNVYDFLFISQQHEQTRLKRQPNLLIRLLRRYVIICQAIANYL